jgi:hypothetical protein
VRTLTVTLCLPYLLLPAPWVAGLLTVAAVLLMAVSLAIARNTPAGRGAVKLSHEAPLCDRGRVRGTTPGIVSCHAAGESREW